jgi:hypothetical protein
LKKEYFMKNVLIFSILLNIVIFSLDAQGLYFDIGLNIGGTWSYLNGTNVSNLYTGDDNLFGYSVGVLSLKAGYGPIANIPLYVVGSFDGIAYQAYSGELGDVKNYLGCVYVGIGPGIIFYPIPLIQLAGTIGIIAGGGITISGSDFVNTALPRMDNGDQRDEGRGVMFDVSAAVDLGRRNHGCLIGIKYTGALIPSMDESGDRLNSHFLSLFVKYAFRHKLKT